ncbi:hypothetical protein CANMA_001686 [Candida margitis]|uniref:uncharacterized protein n=1 Tax=Candida margitis TaxID=1775924 RepID=UPI00222807F3|nr:uncharacterized protein CANMA_001686 [Candida margitis]KAI5969239.1 hypothetical protein CANMA_001686 [Candida margitis]
MTELYFLRHGDRIDHALKTDPEAKPITEDYHAYDPSLATSAIPQLQQVVEDICSNTEAFQDKESSLRKNVYIHFSPYLRCCQTADILITELKAKFAQQFPNYKVRFQLLGDFALSEWVHDKMTNKPPFVDSNDAYNMYTPNLKTLKNKNACSNFRPTVTLGQYNGPNLTYKEYQARCKEYFQKLLATYDKQSYIKNKDVIIIVSHGYLINNLMSYFINHPIFEEIPEAKINLARRLKRDEVVDEAEEFDPRNYYWKLVKDALGISGREGIDTGLNLETDIVYYKTNFIKKDDLIDKPKEADIKDEYKPRASFKIESTSASKSVNGLPPARHNYLCPAAKDWIPDKKHFMIRAEFKEKMMNCEAFKKGFAITNPPSKRVSPDVSPNSAPSKSNSVIDLSKILSNESVQPIKLKYSNTSEIPIHKLNSRVNSQVNLQQYSNTRPTMSSSSAENSSTDLPKYVSSQLQNRNRSSSNPNSSVFVAHHTKDSYFPQVINRVRSNESDMSVDSISDQSVDELDIIKEHHEPPTAAAAAAAAAAANRSSPIETLNRARSLNKKRINNPLFLSYQQKKSQNQLPQSFTMNSDSANNSNENSGDDEYEGSGSGSDSGSDRDEDDEDNDNGERTSNSRSEGSLNSNEVRPLSLSFKNKQGKPSVPQSPPRRKSGPRKNSVKYYSSFSNGHQQSQSQPQPQPQQPQQQPQQGQGGEVKKARPFFYNFETDGDGSDDSEDDYPMKSPNANTRGNNSNNNDGFWFGKNN